MKIIYLIVFVLLPIFSHANNIQKYRIGVENIPYMPFYKTNDGHFEGFVRDLLDTFAKDTGIEFEYIPLPVKRLFKEYLDQKKHIDFKFPDNFYWAQDLKKGRKIAYSHGLVQFTDGVMRLKKNLGQPKSKLKELGALRGFTAWGYLDDIKSGQVKLIENNSLQSLLKLGLKERVNGIFINIDVAKYLLKNDLKKEDELQYDSSLPHTQASYSLSTYSHPEIITKLNKWIKNNKKKYYQILKKWNLSKASTKNN
jgi:hypothetical protein